MKALRLGIVVAMLSLVACASAKPPGIPVRDVAMLAGSYSGGIEETGMMRRPVRMVILPDGKFEITAGDPAGFRFNGYVFATQDGNLGYAYDNDRTNGRGYVYEGGGRRVIELNRADGRATITVDKPLP